MEPANIRQQSSHLTPSSSSSAAAAETRSSEKKLLLESQANENSALIHEKNGEINLAIASNLKAMSNLMEKRSQLENERNQLDLKYKSIEEKIRQLRSKQKSTANTIAVNSEMDDVAFIRDCDEIEHFLDEGLSFDAKENNEEAQKSYEKAFDKFFNLKLIYSNFTVARNRTRMNRLRIRIEAAIERSKKLILMD